MHRGGASLGKLLTARRGQGRNMGSVPQRDHPQGTAEQMARRLREKRLLGEGDCHLSEAADRPWGANAQRMQSGMDFGI